jgi:hypothetical protein
MIAIDFRPEEGILPTIFTMFDREGYTLHDIRVIPSAGEERATLRLCLRQTPSADQFRPFADELRTLEPIIEVIHRAGVRC